MITKDMPPTKTGNFEIINEEIECNLCKKKSKVNYKDIVYVGAYAISRYMCKECAIKRGYAKEITANGGDAK